VFNLKHFLIIFTFIEIEKENIYLFLIIMKTIFSSKVAVLLCTIITLFACDEVDQMNFDNEFPEMQQVSSQVDEGTFISADKAVDIADLFFSELTGSDVSTRSSLRAQRGSDSVETLSESGNSLMYIINYPDGGFVIMGATKNYYPVLAYSDKNSFDPTLDINGVSEWLKETKEAIKTSDTLNDSIKTGMHSLWKNYETADVMSSWKKQDTQSRSGYSNAQIACYNRLEELQNRYWSEGWNFAPLPQAREIFEGAGFYGVYEDVCFGANYNQSPIEYSVFGWREVRKTEQVGPLLTTEWHQGSPFKDLCGGRPAGCAAIAAAQVMKYYQYPQSFTWNGYPFNWNTIPVIPESNSNHAALVRLVGSFVDMHYSSSGSWATPSNVRDGLRMLGYNVTKADHNYETVKKELMTYKRPVIMVGNEDNIPLPDPLSYIGNSHYWVCDGARTLLTNRIEYFTEWQPYGNGVFTTGWNTINSPGLLGGIGYLYFHMNWGWSNGKNNGWFALGDVNTGDGNYKYSRKNLYITKP